MHLHRWPLFLFGLILVASGPAILAMQFHLAILGIVPWYVPALATAGVALMAVSAWQRRGILRIVGLIFFCLVCAFEWFALAMSGTPPYTGPSQAGHTIPAFTTLLANGTALSEKDLAKGDHSVVLFFRGRW